MSKATTISMPSSFEFNDVQDSLRNYMSGTVEFGDVNWTGSAAAALLRVMAYNTSLNQVGLGYLYGELNPLVASKAESVNAIASGILGYLPDSKRGSRIIVDIFVTPDAGITPPPMVTLKRDTTFFATKNGQAFNFSPLSDLDATIDNGLYRFVGVELVQGEWVSEGWPVQTQYGIESYTLANPNIDLSTLEVGILSSESDTNLIKYRRVESAYDLGREKTSYFLRMNTRGNYVIEFGDDRLARKLKLGEVVVVDYATTYGLEGNDIKILNVSGDIGGFFDILVNVQSLSIGGADEESVDTVRRAAPMRFSGQGSAVSSSDYVAITRKLIPGAVVSSWGGEDNDPPKPGYQVIAIKPTTSLTLSPVQKLDITNSLLPFCVGSITPFIVDPDYTTINVKTTVIFDRSKTVLDSLGLKSKVAASIRKYSTDQLEFFGSDFIFSSMITWINETDSSIVGNVTKVSFQKTFIPELSTMRSYTIKFGFRLDPKSIVLNGFVIADNSFDGWKYTIEDDGYGILYLKKVNPDTGAEYVFPGQYGSVDYVNGVATVDRFSPIQYIEGGCVMSVLPGAGDPSFFTEGKSLLLIGTIDTTVEDRSGR